MTQANRPNVPPQVLEALKSGNKAEALKLLKQAAANRAVRQVVKKKAAHHHPSQTPDPYMSRRPGLSPGEVPHGSGGGMAWLILLIGGLLMAYAIIANTPS